MSSERSAGDPPKLSRRQIGEMLDRYRVTSGDDFKLKRHDPADCAPDLVDKDQSSELLAAGVQELAKLQTLLYANSTWSVLIVLQAMDAAGKDGTIKHVMSGVNPQGVIVTPFKQPGPEELAHDFLWRINQALPGAGQIGIFNRSHYEDVLVSRVHPEILDKLHLPPDLKGGKKFWDHRLSDIAHFERHLARQGTVILKFFLNVSRAEQKKRFFERLDDPSKNWKFNAGDIRERARWDDYMDAYEEAVSATASPHAPWFIVPADRKWFARLVVVSAINEALQKLDLKPVELSAAEKTALAAARAELEAEG